MKRKQTILCILAVLLLAACIAVYFVTRNHTVPDGQGREQVTPKDTDTDETEDDSGKDTAQDIAKDTAEETAPASSGEKEASETSGVESISETEKELFGESAKPVVVNPVSGSGERETAEPPSEKGDEAMDFAAYSAMSAEDQYAFYQTFEDSDAFLDWYNAAKADYDKNNEVIVLDSETVIDLGK